MLGPCPSVHTEQLSSRPLRCALAHLGAGGTCFSLFFFGLTSPLETPTSQTPSRPPRRSIAGTTKSLHSPHQYENRRTGSICSPPGPIPRSPPRKLPLDCTEIRSPSRLLRPACVSPSTCP